MKQEKGPVCLLRGVWVKSRGSSEPGFVLREARNTESDPSRAWWVRRGEGPLANSYSVWFWPKAVFGLRESHEGSLPVQSMGQPRWGTKGAAKWRKTLSWGKISIFHKMCSCCQLRMMSYYDFASSYCADTLNQMGDLYADCVHSRLSLRVLL